MATIDQLVKYMDADGRTARSDDTKSKLLDAAAAVVARHGIDGATTERIAAAAKVNKALIAYHFGGKDGLCQAAVERPLAELAAQVASIDQADLPEAQLASFVKALAAAFVRHPLLARFVLPEAAHASEAGLAVRRDMAKIFDALRALLRRGVHAGVFRDRPPLLVHMTLVGALAFQANSQSVLVLAKREGTLPRGRLPSPDAFAQGVFDLMLEGLRP
jgi:TetR/AcrR family transcriptional regulator